MVENDCLGPEGCLGTTLDKLGCIRNVLEEKTFLIFLTFFSSIFQAILACS